MEKHVLFIQGGGEGAYAEDQLLADSLAEALGPDYRVHYPAMPDEDMPDDVEWRRRMSEAIAELPDNAILVGHSLGGTLLMKLLAETTPAKPVAGIFLVSAPFGGADENWQYDDLTLAEDFASKLPKAPVFLYQTRDDAITPFAHLAAYTAKLPNATARALATGGHQLGNDLSIVAADIKTL